MRMIIKMKETVVLIKVSMKSRKAGIKNTVTI